MNKITKKHQGLSRDQRTNRWKLTCPKCGKDWEPNTTMMAKRYEECPKCHYGEVVDYNAD